MATIVADVGIAHNASLLRAKNLAVEAVVAGADAVKFQMFYCFRNLYKYQFSFEQWRELFSYLNSLSVDWFCTPFDVMSVYLLDDIGMTRWKIPSNPKVVHDRFLLKEIANVRGKNELIISTGISDHDDVDRMLQIFGGNNVTLLYCVSKYPCAVEDVHLEEIDRMRDRFKLPIGFSDHTVSVSLPAEAVHLHGAVIVEKHITLDRAINLPDDCVSLDPVEFKDMVRLIKDVKS